MNESEAVTRKNRIDLKLTSSLLNWTLIHNDQVTDTSKLARHAVEYEENKKKVEAQIKKKIYTMPACH